ncbi:hypothetical protein EV424DRAFT_1645823 [Suillus variegatus]|nr:hypothetical protein EV424DRAFT_1645823 [Suillus variegatus]
MEQIFAFLPPRLFGNDLDLSADGPSTAIPRRLRDCSIIFSWFSTSVRLAILTTARAGTKLADARLDGYIKNHLQDIDTTTFFREVLALRPEESTFTNPRSRAASYCPSVPERTYRSMGVDNASDEGIFDETYPNSILWTINSVPEPSLNLHRRSMPTPYENIYWQFLREAASLCPEGHASCDGYLNNLAKQCAYVLLGTNLVVLIGQPGGALVTRFYKRGDADDITQAIGLLRKALTLCPPGHPSRDTTFNKLALALKTRYEKLHFSEDLHEAIHHYRESLRLVRHDHPERYVTLYDLSLVLWFRFTQTWTNENVKEAIILRQNYGGFAFTHPDRHADLSLAVEKFRLASAHPTQGFPSRIEMALRWVDEVEGHEHDSALNVYQVCLRFFDNCDDTIIDHFWLQLLGGCDHKKTETILDGV